LSGNGSGQAVQDEMSELIHRLHAGGETIRDVLDHGGEALDQGIRNQALELSRSLYRCVAIAAVGEEKAGAMLRRTISQEALVPALRELMQIRDPARF
jgi:hypothetical protein